MELININELANEFEFIHPVVITNNLQKIIRDIPNEYENQNEKERLWDILSVASIEIKNCDLVKAKLRFPHYMYREDGERVLKKYLKIKIIHKNMGSIEIMEISERWW